MNGWMARVDRGTSNRLGCIVRGPSGCRWLPARDPQLRLMRWRTGGAEGPQTGKLHKAADPMQDDSRRRGKGREVEEGKGETTRWSRRCVQDADARAGCLCPCGARRGEARKASRLLLLLAALRWLIIEVRCGR